ncbi:PilZ domain-containing protein [Sphingomonas sp. BIUV-7]|uniref:PilZ domain-containing protein n=1 Tax=Sphingomonas natans TaxID=3063330 RepID=A0ABT8Y3W2_9SPHN|nr:PilZ domain-containing protein [Sphingomonas sp. BIUV-7]MDO6413004.1 PilZ domain-containing protein [Sphingomonas sp. BIUV-7]
MTSLKSALSNDYEHIEVETHERRRAMRHTTVFQVAKLCTDRSEELCILRDISDTGLRAEVYCKMEPGEHVVLEMRTGHRVAGTIIWSREPSIGVRFDKEISVPEVLAHCSFDDRLGRIRPPRIDVAMSALLLSGRQLIDIAIRNISQAGLKVASAETLLAGSEVTVRLQGIGQRGAKVRWYRDGEAGLQLLAPLTYAEFAAWRVECLTETAAA